MVATEELIHALTPVLKGMGKSIQHRALPDRSLRSLFAERVEVRDLSVAIASKAVGDRRLWRLSALPQPLTKVSRAELSLWKELLGGLDFVELAEVKVVDGHFHSAKRERFKSELAVEIRGRGDGQIVSWRGRVRALWRARPIDERVEWRIVRWDSQRFEGYRVEDALFVEVLDEALGDPEVRADLRRSRHEEIAREKIRDLQSFRNPHRYFFVGSQDRHPGVAVADVDRNGYDDVYVMGRWGPNRLLLGGPGGTFREGAGAMGLAIEDHSAAAIFADFDNDGDSDLFLGRTMVPSVYLENQDGHFVDRSNLFSAGALPALVSSVSAVDVNDDGLLDIYVSTYAAQMLVFDLKIFQAQNPGKVAPSGLLDEFLPTRFAEGLSRQVRKKGAHIYRNLPGPPNVLLLNRGDKFEPAPDSPLNSFRNTYQATWADYDRDGDADVYLANDFAPNQLLRNDGKGTFVDVTEATATADIGFGMGATWGDYDRDGLQDLYVSNMYSKAGRRVTSHFSGIEADFAKMARGNTLFRNDGLAFSHVSGLEPPKMQVEAAGWSWGGMFADFDNDAHLDLYVASGYYSAPDEVAVAVDT